MTYKGYTYLIGVIIFWGLSFPLSKLALTFMSPFVLTLIRFLVGGAILSIYARGLEYSKKEAINAILNMAIFVILLNVAINFSSNPALASVLIYTQPIFVIILARLFGDVIRVSQAIGVLIAFIGIFISVNSVNFDLGSIIAIIAAILWAFGTIYYSRLKVKNIIKLNAFMSLFSSLFIIPIIPFSDYFILNFEGLSLAILVAIIAQALGFIFWFKGVSELGPSVASSVVILVPASAYFFTFLLLGKIPSLFQLIGSFLALLGVFISQISRLKVKK
ncbi:DMT family transporter [Acidianus sulfidivorans]|uniref:DMT family transporter n=1 Tax=Acidianus sulfidivorans TaxID=312539 RepID=UPI001F0D5D08|nr:DMT family transporter [Acidianus sulfidivorans]